MEVALGLVLQTTEPRKKHKNRFQPVRRLGTVVAEAVTVTAATIREVGVALLYHRHLQPPAEVTGKSAREDNVLLPVPVRNQDQCRESRSYSTGVIQVQSKSEVVGSCGYCCY